MATLTGATIADTYKSLLKATSAVPALVTGTTTENLVFGEDDAADVRTALYVSQDRLGIGASAPDSRLEIKETTSNTSCVVRINCQDDAANSDALILFCQAGTPKGCIGYDDGNNALFVGYDSGTNSTTGINIDSSGKVGVGILAPPYIFSVEGSSSDWLSEFHNTNTGASSDGVRIKLSMAAETATTDSYWMGYYDEGNIEGGIRGVGGDGANFDSISDRRLKTNIVDIPEGLSIISQMKPRNFYWKSQSSLSSKPIQYGFIADEFEDVFPGTVSGKRDDNGELIPDAVKEDGSIYRQMMDAAKFTVPVLVKAVQELSAKVIALENA